jgi:hypothetical protein
VTVDASKVAASATTITPTVTLPGTGLSVASVTPTQVSVTVR